MKLTLTQNLDTLYVTCDPLDQLIPSLKEKQNRATLNPKLDYLWFPML